MTRPKLALAVLGGVLLWVLIVLGLLRLTTWLVVGTILTELRLAAVVAGAYRPHMARR